MIRKKHWYDYLWIYSILYLILGFFNIFFAWLGMIEFFYSFFGGNKLFCNHYCGKGQFFDVLGRKLKLSRNRKPPLFLSSTWFRYSFFYSL